MIIQQVCLGAFRDAESQIWPLFWANSIKESVGHFFVPSHDRFRTLKVEVPEPSMYYLFHILYFQIAGARTNIHTSITEDLQASVSGFDNGIYNHRVAK